MPFLLPSASPSKRSDGYAARQDQEAKTEDQRSCFECLHRPPPSNSVFIPSSHLDPSPHITELEQANAQLQAGNLDLHKELERLRLEESQRDPGISHETHEEVVEELAAAKLRIEGACYPEPANKYITI